jgi:hypothetical protein
MFGVGRETCLWRAGRLARLQRIGRCRQRLSLARAALPDTTAALRDPDAPNLRCMASGPQTVGTTQDGKSHGQEPASRPMVHDAAGRCDAAALLRCLAAGLWACLAAGLWACLAAKTYTPVLHQRFEGDRERTPGRSRV